MSTVNYVDSFYLFASTSSINGWVVPTTTPPYNNLSAFDVALCTSCNNSSPTFPLATFTILPGIPGTGVPSNPLGTTVLGTAVQTTDTFVIALSSALTGGTNWNNAYAFFANPAYTYNLILDQIASSSNTSSTNPSSVNLTASGINNPSGSNFIYGSTGFSLAFSTNTVNNNCQNSALGYDNGAPAPVNGQNLITPSNYYVCAHNSTALPIITFVFVPATPYQCSGTTCSPYTLTNFSVNSVGTPLYSSSTCNNVCGGGSGGGTTKKPIYKEWWFWLLIIGAVVLLIGIIIAIFALSKPKKPPQYNPPPPSQRMPPPY